MWSSICVETLHRLGLTTAIICPGARSTPFTIAFAQHPSIEAISILDERSAAFFGLGLAKRSHRAVALICTSGTAGANFYPAVIEAHVSRVPLLVLTADRPPELRDCNAGQAIDQQKLYGSFVNWYAEMAIPAADLGRLAYARQTMVTAWERSHFPTPGPVHLNLPLRDPLAPIGLDAVSSISPDPSLKAQLNTLAQTFNSDRFFAGVRALTGDSTPLSNRGNPGEHGVLPGLYELLREWQRCDRGLIIVGPIHPVDPVAYCRTVAQLAHLLGFPVLAEGLSPLRNYASLNNHLISTYDAILRHPEDAERLAPDGVIRLGDMPTSKVLRQWLVRVDPLQWVIDPSDRNLDPTHGRTVHVRCGVEGLGAVLGNQKADGRRQTAEGGQESWGVGERDATGVHPKAFLEEWLAVESEMRGYFDRVFMGMEAVCEPKVAWWLARHLPPQTPLFISNSMPVRDVEWFWPLSDTCDPQASQRHIQPYFNRGANGIDGIISTALGVAHHNRPSVLLTGDLAFLHDTNGLLFRSKLKGHLTIVLINNNGGGIFEMLPISQMDPPFEEFFATPQAVDFSNLCQTYGVDHVVIESWPHLAQCFSEWPFVGASQCPKAGIRVLEIRSDRRSDIQLRRSLWQKKR